MIDEIPVSRFGEAQIFLRARLALFLAKRFFMHGALQRGGEPRNALLQDVIAYARFDAFDGGFFTERAGHQQKGDVLAGGTKLFEGLDARPARQPEIGKNRFKFAGVKRDSKLAPVLHVCVLGKEARLF